jgi:hypothetical protein
VSAYRMPFQSYSRNLIIQKLCILCNFSPGRRTALYASRSRQMRCTLQATPCCVDLLSLCRSYLYLAAPRLAQYWDHESSSGRMFNLVVRHHEHNFHLESQMHQHCPEADRGCPTLTGWLTTKSHRLQLSTGLNQRIRAHMAR